MTTEELKKELEELGLELYDYSNFFEEYHIEDENKHVYAQVCTTREYVSTIGTEETFSDPEKQQKLFNAVTKYAATPIKERKPKRYFQYRLKPIADWQSQSSDLEFLNYRKSKKFWVLGGSEQTGEWQTIFEESDPLLDGVHLEMFDAIEVDQEGNELYD